MKSNKKAGIAGILIISIAAALIMLIMPSFASAALNCTLVSITPSDIEANSTGIFEAIINCTDTNDNLNASSMLITRTVEGAHSPGTPNYWSARSPSNNKAQNYSCENISYRILRADGRGDNHWYDFEGIFDDNFTYTANDNNSIRVTITTGTNYTTLNFSWRVEPSVFRSSVFLSRGRMEKEGKLISQGADSNQEYEVYKKNSLLTKFWDLEAMGGTLNYTTCIFRNINYSGNPTNTLNGYFCNSSYNLSTGIKPSDDVSNCVFINSFSQSDLNDIYYSSRNSTYSKSCYGVIDGKLGGIATTDIFYVSYHSKERLLANAYDIRYANGSSGTNVSFKNSSVAWSSTDDGDTWTQANFTPDIWFSGINTGDQFQLGVYIKNNSNGNYTNFTLYTDDIGDVNFPISSPNIEHYHYGIIPFANCSNLDEDMNGTHYKNMTIHVNMAIDPDAIGTVQHNLTLRNPDGTWNHTINTSFYSSDDSDLHIYFDTTDVSDGTYKMNITAIADDDSTDVQSLLTTENFTIDNSPPSWSNNITTIVGNYSAATPSYFNITWYDVNDVDTVYFESDYSGVLQNYTMNLAAGDSTNGTYDYSAIMSVGSFQWKSYANDTVGNWNVSDLWLFDINPVAGQAQGTKSRRVGGCILKWDCTQWSPCNNGTQTRICRDVGTCSSPDKTEIQKCLAPEPEILEKPAKIEEAPETKKDVKKSWFWNIILIILTAISLSVVVAQKIYAPKIPSQKEINLLIRKYAPEKELKHAEPKINRVTNKESAAEKELKPTKPKRKRATKKRKAGKKLKNAKPKRKRATKKRKAGKKLKNAKQKKK